jgi:hypothetical protein
MATAAAMICGLMSQSAWAGEKQDTENVMVRAKVLDGTNLQGCRFVDTVIGQGFMGLAYSKTSVLKAKADASEIAIGLGANAIVFIGIAAHPSNYYVVMANAYECSAQ